MPLLDTADELQMQRLRQLAAQLPEFVSAETVARANAQETASAERLRPANMRYEAALAEWTAATYALSQCLPHNADSRARAQDRVNAAAYQLAEAEEHRASAAHKERQATISAISKFVTGTVSPLKNYMGEIATKLAFVAELMGVMRDGGYVDTAAVERLRTAATAADAMAKATAALVSA